MNKSKRLIKNSILAIFAVSIMLMFSGCVNAYREIEFTKFGFVKGTIDIKAREDYVMTSGKSKDEFVQDLTKHLNSLMNVSSYQANIYGINWYGAGGTVTVPKSKQQVLFEALLTNDVDVTVTESGFFVKDIRVDLKNNTSSAGGIEADFEALVTDIAKYDGVSDDFAIKVPYKIQSTNGIIDSSDPTKATWDLYDFDVKPGSKKTLTITYVNWTPIIIGLIAVGVILLIIFPAIFIPKAIRRKKKTDATDSVSYPTSSLNFQSQRNYSGPMVNNYSPKNNAESTYQFGNINVRQPYASGAALPSSILASNATHNVVDLNDTNYAEQADNSYSEEAFEDYIEDQTEATTESYDESVDTTEEYIPTEEELKEIRKNEILKQFGAGGAMYKK